MGIPVSIPVSVLMIIVIILIVAKKTLGGDQIELQSESEAFEKYSTEEERDKHIITNAVKNLIRTDFEKYPYVLLEKNNTENGTILKYVIPKVSEGEAATEILLKTSIPSNKLNKKLIILPLGQIGIGFILKQTYLVLRRVATNHILYPSAHYVNLVYVRQQGKQFLVEWSMVDESLFDKNRLDVEMCRGEKCDIPHFVFGTCSIASRKCNESLASLDGNKDHPSLLKWGWKTNFNHIDLTSTTSSETAFFNSEQSSPKDSSTTTLSEPIPNIADNVPITTGGSPISSEPDKITFNNEPTEPTLIQNNSSELPPPSPIIPVAEGTEGNFPQNAIHLSDRKLSLQEVPADSRRKRFTKGEKRELATPDNPQENEDVPNSLDLLMLKRSDSPLSESHFQNSLIGARQVTLNPEDNDTNCIGCEKMGNFFDDFEEDPFLSKLVGKYATERLGDYAHLLQFVNGEQDILREHPHIPFIGYGYCNFSREKSQQLSNKSKEVDDLVDFFIYSLRLDCDQPSENRIRAIFTSKFKLLEIQEDFSVAVSHTSPIMKFKILTGNEFKSLMTALVLSKYTRFYREESTKLSVIKEHHIKSSSSSASDEVILIDKKLSKGIRFLTKLVLSLTETFAKKFSQHLIKGLRFILRFLKDKFVSLLQENASSPSKNVGRSFRKGAQREDLNNLYQVMALKEFIIYGLGPISKSGTTTQSSFQSFYSQNENRIKTLVQAYGTINS